MPYSLLGMCSGATLAFELTAALEAISGLRGPDSLIVINQASLTESALRAVDLSESAAKISDKEWLVEVAELPSEMVTDEVLEFFGPIIEADLTALRAYRYNANTINAHIVIVIGAARANFPLDVQDGWSALTRGTCELVSMTGLRPALNADLAALISKIVS